MLTHLAERKKNQRHGRSKVSLNIIFIDGNVKGKKLTVYSE